MNRRFVQCLESYYEGGLALGASHERSVFFATLPAAKSGILAGVVLGIGRAIGETMAVIMIAGNQPRMPARVIKGRADIDGQYCHGNGLCGGSSPGSSHRNRSGFVCLYPVD